MWPVLLLLSLLQIEAFTDCSVRSRFMICMFYFPQDYIVNDCTGDPEAEHIAFNVNSQVLCQVKHLQ